jgi:hypothetical protein
MCIRDRGWEMTAPVLRELAAAVRARRPGRTI